MGARKISDSLYAISGMFLSCANDCTSYLLKGDGGAVLIDCGSGEAHDKVLGNIEAAGVSLSDISLVIGTHGHYDHLAGLEKLRAENPSIKLGMHSGDAGQVEEGDPDLTCAGWFFGSEMPRQAVDIMYEGGECFDEHGMEIEIVHTPGHTPGSISVRALVGDRTYLFTGDSLSPGNEVVRSDREDWERTLKVIGGLEFDAVMPGHANHYVMEPFCMALSARGFARGAADAVFGFLADNLTGPIWHGSVFNYTHITPKLTRFGR